MKILLVPIMMAALALTCVVACSDSDGTASNPGTEAGRADLDGATPSDSGTDPTPGEDGSVTPPAKKETSVDVTLATVARALVRAQFGRSKSDAGDTLYIEAHEGGDPACPTETSPTPKRTLIMSNVPIAAVGSVFTKQDGIAITLLDFTGDQLGTKPATTATALTVTIVSIAADTSVEPEGEATLLEGTATGHVYATYCASLSD